jgi:hypothetical protein
MENTHFGCLRHGLAKELDLEISMCGMKLPTEVSIVHPPNQGTCARLEMPKADGEKPTVTDMATRLALEFESEGNLRDNNHHTYVLAASFR